MITPLRPLPDIDDIGDLQHYVLPSAEGSAVVEFDGVLLGMTTTQQPSHRGHPDDKFMTAESPRCSACRWFEARIFRAEGGAYLLYTVGASILPDEQHRYRARWTTSAFEVVEQLTTRRVQTNQVYLTIPAARVLAQAAGHDDAIKEAYIERAVS